MKKKVIKKCAWAIGVFAVACLTKTSVSYDSRILCESEDVYGYNYDKE